MIALRMCSMRSVYLTSKMSHVNQTTVTLTKDNYKIIYVQIEVINFETFSCIAKTNNLRGYVDNSNAIFCGRDERTSS